VVGQAKKKGQLSLQGLGAVPSLEKGDAAPNASGDRTKRQQSASWAVRGKSTVAKQRKTPSRGGGSIPLRVEEPKVAVDFLSRKKGTGQFPETHLLAKTVPGTMSEQVSAQSNQA